MAIRQSSTNAPAGDRRRREGASPAFLLAQVGAHAAAKFAERLEPLGLTPAHVGALRVIAASAGSSQQEVAARLGMFPSRLVALVDELQGRGLVQRLENPHDRRIYLLQLTVKGKDVLQSIGPVAREHQEVLLASLNTEERGVLASLPDHPMPRAAVRRLVLVAGLLLYIAGTIGSNIAPALIDDHPVGILALSSRNRNLFASVPFIDPVSYAVVGFFRVLAAAVVLFFIGRWYGAKGIGWVEGQVGELPATIRWIQRGVDRAGGALVVLMPGSNIVCLMVGHRRMAPRTFLPLVTVGIVLKLIVLWAGGKLFEDQIKTFLDFIERYQWWIVIGLFALTFFQSAGRVRKSVPEVIEEIERPEDEPVAPPDPARYGAGMDGGPDTK